MQPAEERRSPSVGERVVPSQVGRSWLLNVRLDHLVEDPMERIRGRQGLAPGQLETSDGLQQLAAACIGFYPYCLLLLLLLLLWHHHWLGCRNHLLLHHFLLPDGLSLKQVKSLPTEFKTGKQACQLSLKQVKSLPTEFKTGEKLAN